MARPPLPSLSDTSALKQWLAGIDDDLAERFWRGEPIGALLKERASAVDAIVVGIWESTEGRPAGSALVAVGGYGRGMLHPHSDVDLMILVPRMVRAGAREAISQFLTRLWDLRFEIGHSVRTVRECLTEAKADLTVMTTLMEARLLTGSQKLYDKLEQRVADPTLWPGAEFFQGKRDEQFERYSRFGDSAYNLEPNLKEGPGGLRDIQMLRWVAIRAFGGNSDERLVAEGMAELEELQALSEEEAHLCRVRFGLHLLAGRREDRILFDFQRDLAHRFGFEDGHVENLAVEQMMQRYFRSVMHIERITERVLQAFEEHLYSSGGKREEIIDDWFRVINGYLALRDYDAFQARPALLMEMFVRLAERPDIKGVRAHTVRTIRRSVDLIDERFRADPDVRAAFMQVLRSDADVPTLLARMHRYDILGRYLPGFGAITGRMQYDLFHVYTVDEHTLTVLRRMHGFRVNEEPERFPVAHDVLSRLHKPELLYLAGIFHDIAKGRGGDHSELGAEDAREFCEAHGMTAADTRMVTWLVENHLLMSTTAQKKDISDPSVVNDFAATVANVRYLKFLFLLTCADIAGTSPKLWNSWKATLLVDLYRLTRDALDRGLENPVRREEWISDTREEAKALLANSTIAPETIEALWATLPPDYFLRQAASQVAWHTELLAAAESLPVIGVRRQAARGATEVYVCAEDLDGTFATIVSCIGRLELNIIDARVVNTGDGRIVDTFQVLDNDGKPLEDDRRLTRLSALLQNELTQRPLAPDARERILPRRLRHFVRRPTLRFFEREGRTQMDLYTSDQPALLARLARIFFDEHVRVHGARIATFGERVEDHFVLSDMDDRPLREDRIEVLRTRINETLDVGIPDEVAPVGA